jgi:hypothetical protein
MATYKSIKYLVPVEAVEHTDSINALNDVDTNTVAPTDGQTIKWNGTNWVPSDITEEEASGTQKALFGFGQNSGGRTNVTNLVSSLGVVASDTTGVGSATHSLAASGFGGDKAIFGFGRNGDGSSGKTSKTNLVSNTGVVSSDVTGVGTGRTQLTAAGYGEDKAIFGFGGWASEPYATNVTNLVSNTGVVSTDGTGVGSQRRLLAAASYGGDKALFGFGRGTDYDDGGYSIGYWNMTNLVSNTGVVSADTTEVGTGRGFLAAASYGGDKAIFGFGENTVDYGSHLNNVTNLVSNTGVVASDSTGVGTAKKSLAATGYGGDKAIFGFGMVDSTAGLNATNLVSNTGIVATDTTGVGSSRTELAAAGYSATA